MSGGAVVSHFDLALAHCRAFVQERIAVFIAEPMRAGECDFIIGAGAKGCACIWYVWLSVCIEVIWYV